MSRTREQRRRSRRIVYRLVLTLLFMLVMALVLSAVQYGIYVQEKVHDSAPMWATAQVIDPSQELPIEVLAEASARYEYERDPVLYIMMLHLEEKRNVP